jgi:hypothetical protein
MDKNADSKDTAQLLIFIGGENFEVIEELSGIRCMTGHTTRKKSPVK